MQKDLTCYFYDIPILMRVEDMFSLFANANDSLSCPWLFCLEAGHLDIQVY